MKDAYPHIEEIEQYLSGNMSSSELKAFEERMKTDQKLQHEFDLVQISNKILLTEDLANLKDQMKKDFKVRHQIRIGKWVLSSAVIVGITTGGIFYFNSDHKEESNKVKSPLESTPSNPINQKKETPSGNKSVENKTAPFISKQEKNDQLVKDFLPTDRGVDTLNNGVKNFELPTLADTKSGFPKENKNTNEPGNVNEACAAFTFTGTAETSSSCENEPTGTILLFNSQIKGGLAPYTFSLDGGKFQNNSSFQNLTSGTHIVSIKDANGCVIKNQVLIGSKVCNAVRQYSISPSHGEKWSIPAQAGRNFRLEIRNAGGGLLFQKEYVNDPTPEWDGADDNGNISSGYHQFTIIYLDKDRSYETGYITVVR